MIIAGFGNQEELKYFQENYSCFIESYNDLLKTFSKFFTRKISKDNSDADRVIFNLGLSCCAEFEEITLLCSNGYGIAAQKILRSFYEKAVTADYLDKYPEEAKDFVDYEFVHLYKDLIHSNQLEEKDSEIQEEIEFIKANYQKVKDKFTTTLCKKCGTTRPLGSWTKYDIKTLAEKSGSMLASYYSEGYFQPTLQSHTTMLSIYSRMHIDEETDELYISDDRQRDTAKSILREAHLFILLVLNTQNQRFNLGFDEELMERGKALELCWKLGKHKE